MEVEFLALGVGISLLALSPEFLDLNDDLSNDTEQASVFSGSLHGEKQDSMIKLATSR